MKNKVLLLVFMLLTLVLVSGCNDSKKIDSNIVSFKYHYGSYNGGYYEYDITVSDNIVNFTGKGYNSANLNVDKEIDKSYLDKLNDVLNKNKIYAWDGFNKRDDDVMDGYSFSLIVEYENGEKIDASGYMKYPSNYESGHKALTKFLESIK